MAQAWASAFARRSELFAAAPLKFLSFAECSLGFDR
jgi:hypothetical protein